MNTAITQRLLSLEQAQAASAQFLAAPDPSFWSLVGVPHFQISSGLPWTLPHKLSTPVPVPQRFGFPSGVCTRAAIARFMQLLIPTSAHRVGPKEYSHDRQVLGFPAFDQSTVFLSRTGIFHVLFTFILLR